MRVKPWMALVAILSFVKLMGAFVPPLQVAMEMQFRVHLFLVCLENGHSQVASARPQGTVGRPQFIGSGIEALLFGIFSDLVIQSHNMKGNIAFSKHLNIVYMLILPSR